jgi:hypothetical protein
MNCEVSIILEHKYEQLQQMSDDAANQVSQCVLFCYKFKLCLTEEQKEIKKETSV